MPYLLPDGVSKTMSHECVRVGITRSKILNGYEWIFTGNSWAYTTRNRKCCHPPNQHFDPANVSFAGWQRL